MDQRRFVYILRSDIDPERHYVGITSDVEARLRWHKSGPSGVTIRNRPWSLVVTLEFAKACTRDSSSPSWRLPSYS
jgi:predicted GIY-YIG superfamily endonuclease